MAKIKVQNIGGEIKEPTQPVQEVKVESGVLDVLKKEAVKLGMPELDVDKFESEELLRASINAIKANKTAVETPVEFKESPKEEKVIEKDWQNKADSMKKFFDTQEKITVMIPLEPGEKPGVVETRTVNGREETIVVSGAVWSKTFNGYRVIVPKGTYTPVAKAIAENLATELNQTLMAGEQWKIDRIDPNTGRSVREQLS